MLSSSAPTAREEDAAEPSRAFPDGFPEQALWFSVGSATSLDGSNQIRLESGENPLAVSENVFATVQDSRRSWLIRVRGVTAGTVMQAVLLDDRINEAVIVDNDVFMTGDRRARSQWQSSGVVRLSMSDGSIVHVVTPRRGTLLGNLVRSPSGQLIAVQRYPVDKTGRPTGRSAIDIHRIGHGTIRDVVPLTDMNLMALTDELILMRDEHTVRAYRVADGRRVWDLGVRGTLPGYLTADGSRLIEPVLERDGQAGWTVAAIDPATGVILVRQPADTGAPLERVSNDRYVLFSGEDLETYRSIDLETGAIEQWPVPDPDR